jgi:hypothetical protein
VREGNAANILAQLQTRHESDVDTGKDVAGARGDDEQPDVVGRSARVGERCLARCTRKGDSLDHVPRRLLGWAEGRAELGDGTRDEADVVAEIGREMPAATREARPQRGKERRKLVTVEAITRQRRCKTSDRDRRQ